MAKELVVASTPHETRLAILEDDRLAEIYIERASERALAGNVYKGRVSRVLPGMQSAFVKIGLERDAFLYVTDIHEETEDLESGALDEAEDAVTAPATPSRTEEKPRSAAERENGGGAPSSDEGPSRGRRGRRGRRRRGRGGSGGGGSRFPDAKFASVDGESKSEPAEEEASAAAAAAVEGAVAEALAEPEAQDVAQVAASVDPDIESPDSDILVLPGESLAKYDVAEEADEAAEAQASDEAYEEEAAAEEKIVEEAEPDEREQAFEQVEELLAASEASPEIEPDEPREADDPKGDEAVVFDPASEPGAAEEEPEAESEGAKEAWPGIESEAAARQEEADGSSTVREEAEAKDESGDETPDEGPADPDESKGAAAEVREGAEPARFERRGRRGRRRGRRGPAPAAEKAPASDGEAPPASEAEGDADERRTISEMLKAGQEIIVQIAKEPLGKKGARITSHVALPGRHMVYMPTVSHAGVSRKIASDAERARLRSVVKSNMDGIPGGFIVRTAGQGASEEDLKSDMKFLANLWAGIRERADCRPAPAILHSDLGVVERILRDQLGQNFKTIWVDNEEEYERVLRFVERFQPELVGRVKLYTRAMPIFDELNITEELEKALRSKVWLKSGGYIVINHTEALVAIDVNTGKYVGKSDKLEDTIVNTNLEAVAEITRQMRLRDLGGIIVLDFIDMEDRKNRQRVMQALEQELRKDRAPSKALSFNDFGLVAVTRKRVKQTLERALCAPCPSCSGTGYVKSAPTMAFEILSEARKFVISRGEKKDVVLRVNPEVARLFKSRANNHLQELEEVLGANVIVRGDVGLSREHFDFQ